MERIIIDTDFETDCDDAGALAVFHGLADRGELFPLGVAASVNSPWPAAGVKAFNTAFGRPELPVATNRTKPNLLRYREHRERGLARLYHWNLVRQYPAAHPAVFAPEDTLPFYRKLLESSPDSSVTICAIGLLTSLAELLNSGYRELVARKVRRLVTMAEAPFPEGRDGFNWAMDPVSAAAVIGNWPSELVISPVGRRLLTAAAPCAETPRGTALKTAYLRMGEGDPAFLRPSWDQLAVLGAAGKLGGFAELSPPGILHYNPETGRHSWREDSGGNCRFLMQTADDAALAAYIQRHMIESCRTP